MGGLSYFDEGGQTQPEAVVQAKPTAGKGRIQYPELSGTVPVGRSTLEAMEEMYQAMLSRQQGLSGFLESAKDAQAWWTPGGQERSAALGRRSQARDQQAADLFNMRSQIAQYRSAMDQQEQFNREKGSLLGSAGPSLSATGLDLQPHEEVALSRARTRAEFDKLLNGFIMERTKGLSQPGAAEAKYDVIIDDGEGNAIHDIVDLATKNRLRRENKLIEPGGEPRAAAQPAAAAPAPEVIPEVIPEVTPAVAPPAARPAPAATAAAAPKAYTFEELTPQQLEIMQAKGKQMGLLRDDFSRSDAAELFNKMPLDKRRGIFDSLGPDASVQPSAPVAPPPAAVAPPTPAAPPAAAVAPPPVAAVTPPTTRQRAPTLPQIRAQQELDRQRAGERAKTEAEDERAHNDAARTAVDRERTASEIIAVVSQNPEVVGVLQQPGVAAALATLVKTGISAPGGHSIGVKELDEVLFRGRPNLTREQVVARDRLRSLLNKTSLNAATIMKGQGAVTEFERQLLQNMVGSLENSPENLIKIQESLLENARTRREINSAFKQSKMAWGDFVKTDQYQQIQNNYDAKLRAIEEKPLSLGRPSATANKPAQAPFSADEEAAYQEWKRNQLKKRQQK
jgi:hypothetical protein